MATTSPVTTLRFEIRLPNEKGRYVCAVYRSLSEAVTHCASDEQIVVRGSARDLAAYGAVSDGAGGYSVRVATDDGLLVLVCEVTNVRTEETSCAV